MTSYQEYYSESEFFDFLGSLGCKTDKRDARVIYKQIEKRKKGAPLKEFQKFLKKKQSGRIDKIRLEIRKCVKPKKKLDELLKAKPGDSAPKSGSDGGAKKTRRNSAKGKKEEPAKKEKGKKATPKGKGAKAKKEPASKKPAGKSKAKAKEPAKGKGKGKKAKANMVEIDEELQAKLDLIQSFEDRQRQFEATFGEAAQVAETDFNGFKQTVEQEYLKKEEEWTIQVQQLEEQLKDAKHQLEHNIQNHEEQWFELIQKKQNEINQITQETQMRRAEMDAEEQRIAQQFAQMDVDLQEVETRRAKLQAEKETLQVAYAELEKAQKETETEWLKLRDQFENDLMKKEAAFQEKRKLRDEEFAKVKAEQEEIFQNMDLELQKEQEAAMQKMQEENSEKMQQFEETKKGITDALNHDKDVNWAEILGQFMTESFEAIINDMDEIKRKKRKTENEMAECADRMKQLTAEVEELSKKQKHAESEVQNLKETLTHYNAQVEDAKKEKDSLLVEHKKLMGEKTELVGEVEKAKEEAEKYRKQAEEERAQLGPIQEEMEQIKKDKEKLASEKVILEGEKDKLEGEKSKLQSEKDKLEGERSTLETLVQSERERLEKEKETQGNQIKEALTQYEQLDKSIKAKLNERKAKIKQLDAMIQMKSANFKGVDEDEAAGLQAEKEALESLLKEREAELEAKREELNEKDLRLERALSEQNDQSEEAAEVDALILQKREELQRLELEKEEKINKIEDEIAQQKSENADLSLQIIQIDSELESKMDKLKKTKERTKKLEKKLKGLEDEYEKVKGSGGPGEEQMQEYRQQIDKLTKELGEFQMIGDLKEMLATVPAGAKEQIVQKMREHAEKVLSGEESAEEEAAPEADKEKQSSDREDGEDGRDSEFDSRQHDGDDGEEDEQKETGTSDSGEPEKSQPTPEADSPEVLDQAIKKVFRSLDVDGNGTIDMEEFCLAMRVLVPSFDGSGDPTLPQRANFLGQSLRKTFAQYDLNGDGHIDAYEFQQMVQKLMYNSPVGTKLRPLTIQRQREMLLEEIGRKFDELDTDHDDQIDLNEFFNGLGADEMDASVKNELYENFKAMDLDGNGVIDFAEFSIAVKGLLESQAGGQREPQVSDCDPSSEAPDASEVGTPDPSDCLSEEWQDIQRDEAYIQDLKKKKKKQQKATEQMKKVREERKKLASMQNLLQDLDKMVQGLTITNLSIMKTEPKVSRSMEPLNAPPDRSFNLPRRSSLQTNLVKQVRTDAIGNRGFDIASVWTIEKIRMELQKVLETDDARSLLTFLGESHADDVKSTLFMRSIRKDIQAFGPRFAPKDLGPIVMRKLNKLVDEKTQHDEEMRGRQKDRSYTIESDELSREEEFDDDDELNGIASQWIKKAFNAVEQDQNHFVGVESFIKACQMLELPWKPSEAEEIFRDLDMLELGCLSFNEFKGGIMKYVIKNFTHLVGPAGCEVFDQPRGAAVKTLAAHHPLNVVTVEDGHAKLRDGLWVKQIDIIRRTNANLRSQYRDRSHQIRFGRRETRTITPFAPRKSKDDFAMRPRRASRFFSMMLEDKNMPETLQKFLGGKELFHSRSGLASCFKMIQDGKSLCVDFDTGDLKQQLTCICVSVDDDLFFEDQLFDTAGQLCHRFCILHNGSVYHIDDNLFIVLTVFNNPDIEIPDFEKKLKNFVTQRIRRDYDGVEINTSSSIYEANERFGSFVDRGIQPLRPNWLMNDQKRRLNELLYNLVADKENFESYCDEVYMGQGGRQKWSEAACVQSLRKILKRGGKFTHTDEEGNDVVMLAAKEGYSTILKDLIKSDVDTYRKNNDGMSLLMVALYNKKCGTEVLSCLLDLDQDLKTSDKQNRTVMIHCLNSDNPSIKRALVEKGCSDIALVLMAACENDNERTIRKYHEQGLSLNARVDKPGATLGCIAAGKGSENVLRYLLTFKADLGRDFAGAAPLHYACHFKHISTVQLLIDKHVDLDAQDSNGETPLLCAVTTGAIDVCKILLEHKCNVNLADVYSVSPLLRGAVYGFYDICTLLIQYNADVNLQNAKGEDSVIVSKNMGHHELSDMLFDYQIVE